MVDFPMWESAMLQMLTIEVMGIPQMEKAPVREPWSGEEGAEAPPLLFVRRGGRRVIGRVRGQITRTIIVVRDAELGLLFVRHFVRLDGSADNAVSTAGRNETFVIPVD